MRCYICDFELVIPSGLEAIVACPNCKRNILTDGTPTEEIAQLKGQILALTLVNESQEKNINFWKKEANNWKKEVECNIIVIEELNKKIDRFTDDKYGMDLSNVGNQNYIEDLEKYAYKLEKENKSLKEQLENSWDRHI